MILDPIEIPDELLEAQEQGKLVVFVGAGVSRGAPSNLPDFKGLAKHVAKGTPFEHELPSYEKNLDRFFGQLQRGGVDIQALVRERIGEPKSLPTDLHRFIVDLFPNRKNIRLVTTNFDTHFDTVLRDQGIGCDRYVGPALPLGEKFRGVVYLHGSILRPDDPLVLCDEDFGSAYMTEAWARDFLRGMFETYTTLFIGYSHTDPPVEYLARGMAPKQIPPRYALVSAGDEAWWNGLKIKPITFEKPKGDLDFSHLNRGLHAWAQFSQSQPTDTAQKVRDILRSPPDIKPVKSQTSLLVHCLKRKEECHFFTSEAKGWQWVEWANEHGLLKSIFNPQEKLNEAECELAAWLATALIAEDSNKGLLLVAEHSGINGQELWLALCRNLWPGSNPNFNSPIIQKWALLLLSSSSAKHTNNLGHILEAATKAAPKTLGMAFFKFLTNVRVIVTKGWTFDPITIPDILSTIDIPEFGIRLTGDYYDLEHAWRTCFLPLIPTLGSEYLRILDDRVREIYSLCFIAEVADDRQDIWSGRQAINDKNAYAGANDPVSLLDFLVDTVEGMSNDPAGVPQHFIHEWIISNVPSLTRVGLHALYLAHHISPKDKIKRLIDHGLVYPPVYNAKHETYAVLRVCYSALTTEEKKELWQQILLGPKFAPPDGIKPEDWADAKQYQIDNLIGWLANKYPTCPQASAALAELKKRSSDFREEQASDGSTMRGGMIDLGRSPKTSGELLSKAIESQIEFLLNYNAGSRPGAATRAGLLAAVGDACAQNPQWAVSLFKELARRENWESDLWDGAFLRLRFMALPQDELIWVLGILDRHFAKSSSLRAISAFLFHGVQFSDEKAPSPEILSALIRVAVHIWNQIRTEAPPKTAELDKTEWTSYAINHTAGHIAEFFLKAWSFLRPQSVEANYGWPAWLQSPLQDMIDGKSNAAQLGRAILGDQIAFIHAIEPVWTRRNLFPKFSFNQIGDEAFVVWEPHLKYGYGRLSRDLIVEMLPLYRELFSRLSHLENDLAIGLYRHVAIIIYSCLVDINEGDWLKDFLLTLTENQRVNWSEQMALLIRDWPDDRKQLIWGKWMCDYWKNRLVGKPCPFSAKEADAMLKIALSLESNFTEAIDLLLVGPPSKNHVGTGVFQLKNSAILSTQPLAVIKLINWLLSNSDDISFVGSDLEKMVMQFPKKKVLVPGMIAMCERLATLGYRNALEFKAKILEFFTES